MKRWDETPSLTAGAGFGFPVPRAVIMKLPDTGYPLELIEWVDSSARTADVWVDVEELKDAADLACVSVGWIVRDNSESIVLVSNLAEANRSGCGRMVIPKAAIKKRRRLR